MACMRLGSKSDTLRREGQAWLCSSGLASDVTIEAGDTIFQLHKFPLISRSGLLEKRIGEFKSEDGSNCIVKLDDLPGGSKAIELVAKFCYGMKLEITSFNVVILRCAGEFLEMTEEYGEGNLIAQTEAFLSEVFNSWTDSMQALETCEEVLNHAEKAHVVSRCINSLAIKACSDPSLSGWPISGGQSKSSATDKPLWNGISFSKRLNTAINDWWYEDTSSLSFLLYKRFIKAVEARGMKPERVSGSIMYYANKNIPLMTAQASPVEEIVEASSSQHDHNNNNNNPSESDQRLLLEEIVNIVPTQKGVTPTKFLLKLLKTAMSLHASPSCVENLEKRVGSQLDQASLVDLLIPNTNLSVETMYDLDCVQRVVDHFMQMQLSMSGTSSPMTNDNAQMVDPSQAINSMTLVAELVDSYLAEVAPDVNVKLPKFQSLAAVIPDYARTRYDGFYHAIDIYLKAHPWLTESEREQICRLMNCQKLSLEASTHAAQNERLPLRVIVQVLFFEQLRLRTQISGWFFAPPSNFDTSTNRNQDDAEENGQLVVVGDVRDRVTELEKECLTMRQEIEKLAKTKRRWSIFSKMFARPKTRPNKSAEVKAYFAAKAQKEKVVMKIQEKMHEQAKTMIVDENGNIVN
ncbi:BTB/POZ domain-containing protein At5g03250-like [Silene latifolia]|uniref:BTB/POZ domain-containing protein At5g03250-like n=1 Tax=Silene latifolia TaxID=37657 RepID=UPI003D7897DD